MDTVLEDEREDRDDKAVEEQICEKTDSDSTDDEASGRSESQKPWRIWVTHGFEILLSSN